MKGKSDYGNVQLCNILSLVDFLLFQYQNLPTFIPQSPRIPTKSGLCTCYVGLKGAADHQFSLTFVHSQAVSGAQGNAFVILFIIYFGECVSHFEGI